MIGMMIFPKMADSPGITTMKIMMIPCRVKTPLYVCGPMMVSPGLNSSTLMVSPSTTPTKKKVRMTYIYISPILLWSVDVSQSRSPLRFPCGSRKLLYDSCWFVIVCVLSYLVGLCGRIPFLRPFPEHKGKQYGQCDEEDDRRADLGHVEHIPAS